MRRYVEEMDRLVQLWTEQTWLTGTAVGREPVPGLRLTHSLCRGCVLLTDDEPRVRF